MALHDIGLLPVQHHYMNILSLKKCYYFVCNLCVFQRQICPVRKHQCEDQGRLYQSSAMARRDLHQVPAERCYSQQTGRNEELRSRAFFVNSFCPSDAISQHKSGSTSAHIMACCLMASSHYLNWCWLIISKVQCHSSQSNFTRDTSAIIHRK